MKERTEKIPTGIELKLRNLNQTASPYKTFIKKEVPMLENLVEYYKKANGKTKKKILGCIFSKISFGERESCNLRIHSNDTGFTQCQQGFQKSGHKKRGRK